MTIDLSVVIVCLSGGPFLQRCLNALKAQRNVGTMEIVVPVDDRLHSSIDFQEQFPEVRFLRVTGERTFAELRSAGLQAATGRILALTEDQCIPDDLWCYEMLRSHTGTDVAVGGTVDKGFPVNKRSDTALNWAVYFCDYVRYANPVVEANVSHLTDCNVSYKREMLYELLPLWQREFHENVVHAALQENHKTLRISPRMVVRQQRNLEFLESLAERFRAGRVFGSTRVAQMSWQKRIVFAIFSIFLPLLLTIRIAAVVFQKKKYMFQFVRCLPLILLLNLFWAFGECFGYLKPASKSSLFSERISA